MIRATPAEIAAFAAEAARRGGSVGAGLTPTFADEKAFMAAVIAKAKEFGWRVYHTHDSRRSEKGFPDLVCVKPPWVIFLELKSENGKLRPEQKAWLNDLRRCDQLSAECFWPADFGRIVEILGAS